MENQNKETLESLRKDYKELKKEIEKNERKGIASTFHQRNRLNIMQKKLRKAAVK